MYYLRTRAAADAIKFTVDQQALARRKAARAVTAAAPNTEPLKVLNDIEQSSQSDPGCSWPVLCLPYVPVQVIHEVYKAQNVFTQSCFGPYNCMIALQLEGIVHFAVHIFWVFHNMDKSPAQQSLWKVVTPVCGLIMLLQYALFSYAELKCQCCKASVLSACIC